MTLEALAQELAEIKRLLVAASKLSLSVEEAAFRLSRPAKAVYGLVANGRIKVVRDGTTIMVPVFAIEDFLRKEAQ